MPQLIKPLRSGQITIPAALRQKLGIDEETLLQVRLVGGELRLKPVQVMTIAEDTTWFKRLYDRFGKVRKEANKFPEKEIDTTIDKAIRAVRSLNA